MKNRRLLFLFLLLIVFSPFVGYISFAVIHSSAYNVLSALTTMFFLFFLFNTLESNRRIVIPKYLWFYIVFVLYTVVSDAVIVGKTLNVKYWYSNYLITAIFAFIIVENVNLDGKYLKSLNRSLSLIVLVAFITIIVQQFIDESFFVNFYKQDINITNGLASYEQRLPSIFSWIGPLETGFTFLPFLAILINNSLFKKQRMYLWLWLLIGLIFSFFTRYRWVMLNYALLLFLPFIYFKDRLRKLFTNIIVITFILILGLSISDYFGAPVYDIIENRIMEKSRGGLEKGSASTRLLAFYVFAKLYPENPVFGKGMMHTFSAETDKDYKLSSMLGGRSSQIHVGYLSLLYYYGLIGGIFFMLFLVNLLKRLYKHAQITGYWAPFISFTGYAIANLTLVEFKLFHAGFLLIIAYDRFFINNYLNKRNTKIINMPTV